MFPLCPLCWQFYHMWVLKFVKCLSASIVMIMWFLPFSLLMWCIILFDLQMLSHPCTSGKFLLIMAYDPFNVLEFGLLILYWGFFHLCLLVILAVIFSSCGILVWFWYQGNAHLIKWIWKCSFLFYFFGRIWEGLVLILL